MQVEGLIQQIPVWDMVAVLYRQRHSGILTLRSGPIERVLYLHAGRIVFARSNIVDERLGEKLVRWGYISLRDMVQAAREIRPGRRLGMVLVEKGLITPDELVRAVIRQVREIVWGAFSMDEGTFLFDTESTLPSEVITLNIPMPLLLYESIMNISSWALLQRSIGPLNTTYVLQEEARSLFSELPLDQTWESLLDYMREPRTLEQILAFSATSDFETARFLVALLALNGAVRPDYPESPFELLLRGESFDDTTPMPALVKAPAELNLDLSFSDLVDLVDQGDVLHGTLRFLPRFQPPATAVERSKCQHRYLWVLLQSLYGAERAFQELRQLLERLALQNPVVWHDVDVQENGELDWDRLAANLVTSGRRPYTEELDVFLQAELEMIERCLNPEQMQRVHLALDRIDASFTAAGSETMTKEVTGGSGGTG